jgi:pimeloyl-ACP methyl ester carboxylesterase
MGNSLIALLRNPVAVMLAVLTLSAEPAAAQLSGDQPLHVTASYATRLSRYYAPYALQAAAAYLPVRDFESTRQAGTPGADVTLAVSPYAAHAVIQSRARKALQAWQYQFGSEGYLTCLDNDPDCRNALPADRWTFALPDGPSFQVWARTVHPQRQTSCNEVSIAFRGTMGSFADWASNFSPITSYVADDYYRQLRRNIDAIIKRIVALDCYKKARRPQIVSVGHSLGGGLAQMAALANNPARPRIAKVFAFDPSPVTGAELVDKRILSQNAKGLEIDRVYQTGEVLERLRGRYEQFPKSTSTCAPQVRTVVYDAIAPTNSIGLHNMAGLAGQMVDLSYDGDRQLSYATPRRTDCPTRYRAPASDEDTTPEPGTGAVANASGGPATAWGRGFNGWQDDQRMQASWFGAADRQAAAAAGSTATRVRATRSKRVGSAIAHRGGTAPHGSAKPKHSRVKAAQLGR